MERRSVEAIVRALNDAGVRYLIAGGVAVVAHGYVRFTADLDVILDLETKICIGLWRRSQDSGIAPARRCRSSNSWRKSWIG